MNDVERELRRRFARADRHLVGPGFAPPALPTEVRRRTHRRQARTLAVGFATVVAIVAATVAGAGALLRSSEQRVPLEPPDTSARGALEAVASQPISFEGLVADTEGRLWSTWPVLTSYDPATGALRSFTKADDPRFAGAGPATHAIDGGVWLVIFDGPGGELAVARFEGDRLVETSTPAPTDYVGAIAEAPNGIVWVGGNGVFAWDGASWSEVPSTGRPSREAGDITVDTAGNVWVKDIRFPGPEWLGISRFDGNTWTSYPLEEVLPSDRLGVPKDHLDRGSLWTTVAGADGDVWVGGAGGISHFVDGTWTSDPSLPLGLNNVMSVAVADGTVWIGGEAIGAPAIARFDGATWSRVEQGLTDNGEEYQYTTVVAAEDQIWAAVNGALLRWDGEAFVQVVGVDRPQELMSPLVAVGRDELWTGDWGAGGAWRLRGDTWTHFDDRVDLPGELQDLALAPDGTLWATTEQGIWRFDGSRWGLAESGDFHSIAFGPDGGIWVAGKHTVQRAGGDALPGKVPFLSDTTTLAVFADDDVWASSSGGFLPGGLAHFDGTRWAGVEPVEGHTNDFILDLEITPDGNLWASLILFDATDLDPAAPRTMVVARFDGSSWRTYRDAGGVQFDSSGSASGRLELTPDGTLVLGAESGLVAFRGGAWTLLQEGSFQDFSIAPDGAIWVSSDGLYRLPAP